MSSNLNLNSLNATLHQAVLLATQGNLYDALGLISSLGLSEEQKRSIDSILQTATRDPFEAPSLQRRIFTIIVCGNVETQSPHEPEQNVSTALQTESQPISQNESRLLGFPKDVIHTILLFLKTEDFFGCQLVCKDFNQITRDDGLCRTLYNRDFSPHYPRQDFSLGFYNVCKDSYTSQINFLKGVCTQRILRGTQYDADDAVAISGRKLYLGSYNIIRILDLDTGVWSTPLQRHRTLITSLAVLDKKLCLGDAHGQIAIWDLVKGTRLHTLQGHQQRIESLAVSDDNKLCSCDLSGVINIWDLDNGTCLHTLHQERVISLFVVGKKLCSGFMNGGITIWDLDKGTCLHTLRDHFLKAHVCHVSSFAVFDGKLCSGDAHGKIKIWDLDKGTCLHTLERDHGAILSLAVLDGKLCSGSSDGTIEIWDLETGDCLNTFKGHVHGVPFLAIFDGALYSGSDRDGMIKIWDFQAKHTEIFAEITCLLNAEDKKSVKIAMKRFSKMPKAARNKIYGELYHILKPFSNDYFRCGEHAFHGQYELSSTPKQRAQAIEQYLHLQGANSHS